MSHREFVYFVYYGSILLLIIHRIRAVGSSADGTAMAVPFFEHPADFLEAILNQIPHTLTKLPMEETVKQ